MHGKVTTQVLQTAFGEPLLNSISALTALTETGRSRASTGASVNSAVSLEDDMDMLCGTENTPGKLQVGFVCADVVLGLLYCSGTPVMDKVWRGVVVGGRRGSRLSFGKARPGTTNQGRGRTPRSLCADR